MHNIKEKLLKLKDKIPYNRKETLIVIFILLCFCIVIFRGIYRANAKDKIAKEIEYIPTNTTLTATNVQDAIEQLFKFGKGETITNTTSYLVQFECNGCSDATDPKSQNVAENGKVTKPSNPEKSGYTFDKWYSNETLTTAYDFNSSVNSDLTLYAKYIENVTFADQTLNEEYNVGVQTIKVNAASGGIGSYTYSKKSGESDITVSSNGNITIPAGKAVGTYTIVVTATSGTLMTDATYTIVINKVAAEITCQNKDYTGSAQTIATCAGGTINNAAQTNAGDYVVTCTGDSNHTDATSKTCKINKVKAQITCQNKDYNGSAQTIATCAGGTANNATQTNAGDYAVACTGDSNHTNADGQTCKINKVKAQITCQNKDYNGSAQTIATCTGGTISNATQTNVGNYTVTCTGDSNHTNADGQTCKINKLNDVVTIEKNVQTYTGSAVKATITTLSKLTPTVTYYTDSSCTTKTGNSGAAPTAIGTYYAIATTAGNANYNAGNSGCKEAVNIIAQTNFTVTYDYATNGGSSATKTTDTKKSNTAVDLSVQATKSGYTFLGWNTNKDAHTAQSSITMPSSNLTVYAIYKSNIDYELLFDGNGASLQGTSTFNCYRYNNDTSCNVTATSPTIVRNSYVIVGFNTNKNAQTGTWDANSSKTITLTSDTTTYYAITKTLVEMKFNANNNTITSRNCSGTCQTASGSEYINESCYLYNKDTTCQIKVPSISGSSNTPNVVGFKKNKNSDSNNTLASGSDVNITKDGFKYNSSSYTKELNAVTSSNTTTYSVTYTKESGISAIGKTSDSCTTSITYNGSAPLNTCKITLPTITLSDTSSSAAWYNQNNSYRVNEVVDISSNTTFVAKATTRTYTIIFNTNGGTTIENQIVVSNTTVSKPSNPIKEGYTFEGWYSDASLNNKYDFTTKVNNDMTLYAKYTKNSSSDPSDATQTIKTKDDKNSVVIDKDVATNNNIKEFKVDTITGDAKEEIENRINETTNGSVMQVIETRLIDNEGNDVDLSNKYITNKITLPDGVSKDDNIKIYQITPDGKEEISYTIENGKLVFTTRGTGQYAIVVIPKKELKSSNNENVTISMNDNLSSLVESFEAKPTDEDKNKFSDAQSVYIFDSNLYDSNSRKIDVSNENAKYTVDIPSGMSSSDNIHVYKINNGNKEEISYTIENGKIVFTSSATGRFAIVKYAKGVTPSESKTINAWIPQTGVTVIKYSLIIAVLSGVVIALIFINKKINKKH